MTLSNLWSPVAGSQCSTSLRVILLCLFAGTAGVSCQGETLSSSDGPPPGLVVSADEIITAQGRVGTTRVVLADSSRHYSFSIGRVPAHGSAGIDGVGRMWFQPSAGFLGRDAIKVHVATDDPRLAPADLVVSVLVRSIPANGPGARVYSSPYEGVHWGTDYRLKVQLHDHPGTTVTRIRAYDRAGYDVVSLMDYSGARALPYSLRAVPWPVEDWLPALFLSQRTSIKFFIPNAEQVGYAHLVSPFMTTYIERWQDSVTPTPVRAAWQYASAQEAISLIKRYGGLVFVAHPWYGARVVARLDNYTGMEIYSAFARYRAEEGVDPFFTATDRNAMMLAAWDTRLLLDQSVVGIAVNDHFGPDNTSALVSPRTRDSGKILAFTSEIGPVALRASLARGAVLAVEDVGLVKDRYPQIDSIVRAPNSMTIVTTGEVAWIANGHPINGEPTLDFGDLPSNAVYVRATVTNAEGSRVHTQAFPVRRIGDTDGDGDIDTADDSVCTAVRSGTDRQSDHAAACEAVLTSHGSPPNPW